MKGREHLRIIINRLFPKDGIPLYPGGRFGSPFFALITYVATAFAVAVFVAAMLHYCAGQR